MKEIIVKNIKHLEQLAKRKNKADIIAVITSGEWNIPKDSGLYIRANSGSRVEAWGTATLILNGDNIVLS